MFTSLFLKLLNAEAASAKSKADEIIRALPIRPGDAIADIGSGGGYFTLLFAERVGEKGRVYAVDVKRNYLDFIRRNAGRAGLDNISYILAERDPGLPVNSINLAFARNVFHHLPEPESYFRRLKQNLKPGGQVVIIEHKPKRGFGFVALFKHHTSTTAISQVMEKAGYIAAASFDFLPDQSFTWFKVKN